MKWYSDSEDGVDSSKVRISTTQSDFLPIMADAVVPETPHYVLAPETQAAGELTELTTGVSSLMFPSQWTMPTFLS